MILKAIILVIAIVTAMVAMQTTVNIPQFLKINSNYILLPEAFAQLREGSNIRDYSNDYGSNIRDYSNDFKTYENNDLGIKFQYPESWKYSDKSGDIIFTPRSGEAFFIIKSVVMKDRVTDEEYTYSNVVDVANTLIEQYKSSNPSTQVFSITPNEDLSVLIRMSWTTRERIPIDVASFIMKTDNNEFLLMEYEAYPETYSKYVEDITNLISSLEITDGKERNNDNNDNRHNDNNDNSFKRVYQE